MCVLQIGSRKKNSVGLFFESKGCKIVVYRKKAVGSVGTNCLGGGGGG